LRADAKGAVGAVNGFLLAVPPSTPAVPCHLLGSAGVPYAFNAAFEFRPGLAIRVGGYTDVRPLDGTAAKAIEVRSIAVLGLPSEPGADSDGNLPAEVWEEVFFGESVHDDHLLGAGGKSLVQLYFDAALMPTSLSLGSEEGGLWTLRWRFPAAYAWAFRYELEAGGDLAGLFSRIPAGAPVVSGSDNARSWASPTDQDQRFWRLRLRLAR
jgi:hypothetical protein